MKKRFTEEQIIGFLREAEAGLPVKDLCRQHGFSEASYYLWRFTPRVSSEHDPPIIVLYSPLELRLPSGTSSSG